MRKLLFFCLTVLLFALPGGAEDRDDQKQYVNVATDIIASYSRHGVVDFTGLARALETEGNAALAGEVLKKLVKIEPVEDPRGVVETTISTLDVASVVRQVSDPRFLRLIQTSLKQQRAKQERAAADITDPFGLNETLSYLIYNSLFAKNVTPRGEK